MVPGHNKAVVVIVRGLGDISFREIIYYSSEDINRSTLEALIIKVEETGAKVESCVFARVGRRVKCEATGRLQGRLYFNVIAHLT